VQLSSWRFAAFLAGVGRIGGIVPTREGDAAPARVKMGAKTFFIWRYSLVLTCTDLYWLQLAGAELQLAAGSIAGLSRGPRRWEGWEKWRSRSARGSEGWAIESGSSRPPFPDVQTRSHGDYRTSGNGQKTYGRFLGMIFLGGVGSPLVLERQPVTREKIQKSQKNAKKSAK
jgi:hypothetical protein